MKILDNFAEGFFTYIKNGEQENLRSVFLSIPGRGLEPRTN